jgi:hypothetical protein
MRSIAFPRILVCMVSVLLAPYRKLWLGICWLGCESPSDRQVNIIPRWARLSLRAKAEYSRNRPAHSLHFHSRRSPHHDEE